MVLGEQMVLAVGLVKKYKQLSTHIQIIQRRISSNASKEHHMDGLLKTAIARSGGDDLQFFESCYYWKHKKHVSVWGDILAYRTQGRIPDYVLEFLNHSFG